jgi:integrase
VKDSDGYRTARLGEKTIRKKAPAPASLDLEVELLKRMLNYAVACGSLKSNPIAAVKLLRRPNVRRTEEAPTVFLTGRVREALELQPRFLKSAFVFTNPETEKAWRDVRTMFARACKAAGLTGVWFHDLRRSFVTNARRRGVPESVVMKMSGHRTRAVFDRYNIVEEDDLREAVKRIEAGRAPSSGGSSQDLDKVTGD